MRKITQVKEKFTLKEAEDVIFGVGVNSYNRLLATLDILSNQNYDIEDVDYWKILRCGYEASDNINQ
ncbi:MAG: hypothetical protein RR854_08910 [Muribaculaceae bacterium]